jgi:hypothetical protein
MQILRNFQTNFVRNQKLSKTQNNPKKILKWIQIQTYVLRLTFILVDVGLCSNGHPWPNIGPKFSNFENLKLNYAFG